MESEITKEPIKKKGINKKKSSKVLMVFFIVVAIVVIMIGIYINYYGNSKRIFKSAVDNISTKIKNTVNLDNMTSEVGDNYTTSGSLKINVESDYLNLLSSYNDSYRPYINLINNLAKTDNTFKIAQNKKEKKMLATFDSKLNNEELISGKYLIQNKTQYYFITGLLDTYINNGESKYFESLDEENTSKENIIYMYDFLLKSFKSNLKDSYFTKNSDTINITGKDEKVIKVSLKITNEVMKEFSNNILKDIKNDKKASEILSTINPEFKNAKISDNDKILSKDEEIIFNIYTTKLTYKIEKYEIEIVKNNKVSTVNYYENDNKGNIQILEDKKVLYSAVITKDGKKKNIVINDASNKKVGTIIIDNDIGKLKINSNVIFNDYIMDLNISNIITEKTKNKNYDVNSTVECKISMMNSVLVNISINVNANITDNVTINEDLTKVTDSQAVSTNLQNKLTEVLVKLMS